MPMPARTQTMTYSDIGKHESSEILQYVLKNVSPVCICDRLLSGLTQTPRQVRQEDVDKLLECFRAFCIPTDVAKRVVLEKRERRCGRCHQIYLECENGPDACEMGRVVLKQKDSPGVAGSSSAASEQSMKEVTQRYSTGRHTTVENMEMDVQESEEEDRGPTTADDAMQVDAVD